MTRMVFSQEKFDEEFRDKVYTSVFADSFIEFIDEEEMQECFKHDEDIEKLTEKVSTVLGGKFCGDVIIVLSSLLLATMENQERFCEIIGYLPVEEQVKP